MSKEQDFKEFVLQVSAEEQKEIDNAILRAYSIMPPAIKDFIIPGGSHFSEYREDGDMIVILVFRLPEIGRTSIYVRVPNIGTSFVTIVGFDDRGRSYAIKSYPTLAMRIAQAYREVAKVPMAEIYAVAA
jgi:hypothetical protein